MKYSKTKLCMFISVSLAAPAGAAEIGVVPQGLGTLVIGADSSVTASAGTSVIGIGAGSGDDYSVADNGALSVAVTTTGGSATGVSVKNSGKTDLGTGTVIAAENTGTGAATGIIVSNKGEVTAAGIDITAESQGAGAATGLNIGLSSSVTLTGDRNRVTVSSTHPGSNTTAVTVAGQSGQHAVLTAENLDISTNGTGINAQPNSRVILTGDTVIRSGYGGIEALGSSFTPGEGGSVSAGAVSVTTTASSGGTGALFAQLGGTITAGEGSAVQTENMHGLYATTVVGYPVAAEPTTITYTGSDTNRNTVRVGGQSGVTSFGEAAVVDLSYTDITASAQNGSIIGVRALAGGVVNADNTTVTVSDNNPADGEPRSLAAVLARNQDAVVNFTGSTVIDASQAQNNTALMADGTGSRISVSDNAVITGDVVAQGDNTRIDLNLHDGSLFTGAAYIPDADTDGNPVSGSAVSVSLTDSRWDMTGDSVVTSLTLNSGAVLNLNTADTQEAFSAGNTLTVQGDYTGNGGTLIFNAQPEGDDSVTDRLRVTGNTSGDTYVRVNNLGGRGAQTAEGIELIRVEGDSAGTFIQDGRIVAGAYDYRLTAGQGAGSANWYLTSALTTVTPEPESPESPESPVSAVRPEAGAYAANLHQANNLFNVRLHDRPGETQYTDIMTGEHKVTSMWLRNVAGHTNVSSGNGQLKTGSNRYVMQLGGDIAQWTNNGDDRYHLGVMAGYGHVKSSTGNRLSGNRAAARADGYSAGVYGTYYANEAEKTGLYADGWMQYNWFDNSVKGDDLAEEKYRSKGVSVSAEAGYTFLMNETAGSSDETTNRWYVQPKAQVTYSGVKMDGHTEQNGTRVSGRGEDNIQTRLGVKVYGQGHVAKDNGTDRDFQPFAEVNWLHNTRDAGVSMDGSAVNQSGTRDIGEIKVGLEGRLTKNTGMWFNVAQQVGSDSYTDTQGILGIKVRF